MLHTRISPQVESNSQVKIRKSDSADNAQWLESASASLTASAPKLFLAGGAGVADFHIRTAQAHARRDLMPSFWNHCGIYFPASRSEGARIWHVSLEINSLYSSFYGFSPQEVPSGDHIGLVPKSNGILESTPELFADTSRWRNLALIEFDGMSRSSMQDAIDRARKARLQLDFVSPIVAWLGYVWGAANSQNPLLLDTSLPAASFVQAIFSEVGVDVAPGMHDRSLCPETFWQTSKWWSEYYVDENNKGAPRGRFLIRQREAYISG